MPTVIIRKHVKRKGLKNPVGTVHWPENLAHHAVFTHVVNSYSLISNLGVHFICFGIQYCFALFVSHINFALYRPNTTLFTMKHKT